MFSDHCYHTEDEFYYPEDLYIEESEPSLASTSYVNNDKSGKIANDIQDFILSKRPENTLKKTKYDMNIWKNTLIRRTNYEILKTSQQTS